MRNLLVLSLLAVAVASQAATLNITGLALGNTGTLNLSTVAGLTDGTYSAGPFAASLDGGASMRVFCGDLLDHTIYNAPGTVSLQDTHVLGGGYAQAARLLNKYGAAAGDSDLLNAALQGAIWKSLYPTLTLSDGTPGASALVATYLADPTLSTYSDRGTFYNFGGANQSMISAKVVPEPASLAALAVGAVGLLRRRKR